MNYKYYVNSLMGVCKDQDFNEYVKILKEFKKDIIKEKDIELNFKSEFASIDKNLKYTYDKYFVSEMSITKRHVYINPFSKEGEVHFEGDPNFISYELNLDDEMDMKLYNEVYELLFEEYISENLKKK